jgi:ketosteroid isomerase-like protein
MPGSDVPVVTDQKDSIMEENVPNTALGRLYREHIRLILAKDIEGVLDQYTPDALLISSFSGDRKPRYFRGRDELREHFQGILGLKDL